MSPNPMNPAGTEVPVYDRRHGRSPWRDRLVAGALCLVIGGVGGFALGRATASTGPATLAEAFQMAQEGTLPQGDLQGPGGQGFPGGGQAPGGQGQRGQGSGGGPAVQGDITSVSGDVLTVSTQAGELKVQLTGSTEIRRAVAAKASDLAVGDSVSVQLDPAASNSGGGTVTASSVTEEPAQ